MAEIIQIDDSTWRIEDNFVRMFLLEGTEKALLIDSGLTTKNAKELAEGLTKKPLILLNTHSDGDHIAGNEAFGSFYMHPADEPNYRKMGKTGTLLPVEDGDVIDLGERPLQIISIPGHTPGSIAVLDLNNRILFSGDTVQDSVIYMFSERRDMPEYIRSLKKLCLLKDRFDTVYGSHGSVPLPPDQIDKLIDGAEKVLAGECEGEEVEVHGNRVMRYMFPYAGFYRDLE